MSEEYRLKLRNFFCSMLLVLLIALIPLLYFWFFLLPYRMEYISGFDELSIPIRVVLEQYAFLFLPILVWHIADFLKQSNRWLSLGPLSNSHRFLAIVLVMYGFSIVLVSSTFLNDLGCPEVILPEGVFQFDGCGTWTPEWKLSISIGFWLLICVLALWKLTVAIASRIRKTQ
ncbi:MAG: hypothetical protein ABJ242_08485 [Marinomonas sp.]